MRVRGVRLEVDSPSEQQLRNARWMAKHPVALALVLGVVFCLIGVGIAPLYDDASWVSRPVGGAIGAICGVAAGLALSIDSRRVVPRGKTAIAYWVFTVILLTVAVALRLAR